MISISEFASLQVDQARANEIRVFDWLWARSCYPICRFIRILSCIVGMLYAYLQPIIHCVSREKPIEYYWHLDPERTVWTRLYSTFDPIKSSNEWAASSQLQALYLGCSGKPFYSKSLSRSKRLSSGKPRHNFFVTSS